jgi:hypothetical protein
VLDDDDSSAEPFDDDDSVVVPELAIVASDDDADVDADVDGDIDVLASPLVGGPSTHATSTTIANPARRIDEPSLPRQRGDQTRSTLSSAGTPRRIGKP